MQCLDNQCNSITKPSSANITFPEKFNFMSFIIESSDAPQNKICDGTKVFGLSSLAKMPKSIDEV